MALFSSTPAFGPKTKEAQSAAPSMFGPSTPPRFAEKKSTEAAFQAVPGAFESMYGPKKPEQAMPPEDPMEHAKQALAEGRKAEEKARVEQMTYQESRDYFGDRWGKMSYREAGESGATGQAVRHLIPAPLSEYLDSTKAYYRQQAQIPPELRAVSQGDGFWTKTIKGAIQNAQELGIDAMENVALFGGPDAAYPMVKQFTQMTRTAIGIDPKEIAKESQNMTKGAEMMGALQDTTAIVTNLSDAFFKGGVGNIWKWKNYMVAGDLRSADELASKMAFDFVDGLSSFNGLGDKLKENYGVTMDDKNVYVRGIPVRELSEAERNTHGGMKTVGALYNSLALWSKISPWIDKGVISTNPAFLAPLATKHPVLFRGLLTNAVEQTGQAVVSGIAGVPYSFGDMIFGFASQFATSALIARGVPTKGGIPILDDVDTGRALGDAEAASKTFVMENGRAPSDLELQSLLGDRPLPGRPDMTWNDVFQQTSRMYGDDFDQARFIDQESRLIEMSGGKKGRPGIDYPAEITKKFRDGQKLSVGEGGKLTSAEYDILKSQGKIGRDVDGSMIYREIPDDAGKINLPEKAPDISTDPKGTVKYIGDLFGLDEATLKDVVRGTDGSNAAISDAIKNKIGAKKYDAVLTEVIDAVGEERLPLSYADLSDPLRQVFIGNDVAPGMNKPAVAPKMSEYMKTMAQKKAPGQGAGSLEDMKSQWNQAKADLETGKGLEPMPKEALPQKYQDGYLYRAMSAQELEAAKASGTFEPHSMKSLFFATSEDIAHTLGKVYGSDSVIVRVPTKATPDLYVDPFAPQGYSFLTRQGIPIDGVEMKGADGSFLPVEPAPAPRFSTSGDIPLPDRFSAPPDEVAFSAGGKIRQFSESIQESNITAPEVKDIAAVSPDRFYEPITNQETLNVAREAIAKDEGAAVQRVLDPKAQATPEMNAMGMELIRKYSNEGTALKEQGKVEEANAKFEQAAGMADAVMKKSTTTAQALQSLAMMSKLSKEGALVYAAKQLDTTLTPEQAGKVAEFTDQIAALPDGQEKIFQTARMLAYIAEQNPKGFWTKVSGAQTISLLLAPKSIVRNILGGASMVPAEGTARLFSAPLDAVTSIFTGERTVAPPALFRTDTPITDVQSRLPGIYPAIKGMMQGVREAYAGVDTKGTSARYFSEGNFSPEDIVVRKRVFSSPLGKALEGTLGAVLGGPDRAFWERGFAVSIENQTRAAGIKLEDATPEMIDAATLSANRMIFEEPSRLRDASVGFKKVLNLNLPFGVGDVIHKFPGIPATILKRMLEYSPAGYAQTVVELGKGIREAVTGKGEFNQKAFVDSFGRATVGTAGALGIGYKFRELGILTGSPDDDSDMEAVKRKLGMGKYSVNVDALMRYSLSFDPKDAKRREGDTIASYDWFQPFGADFSMGANLYDERQKGISEKAGGLSSTVMGAIEGGTESIEGLSMVQGLRTFLYGDKLWLHRFVDASEGLPATFVPSLFNQVRQFTDNTSRETYDPEYLQRVLNRVKSRVPGLSEMLPERIDATSGQPLQIYQNDSNTIYNVFFNPAFMTEVVKDKQLQEIFALYQSTGETAQAPRLAGKSVTVDGEKRILSGKEVGTYQKFLAQETRMYFDTIMNTPGYAKMNDEMRVQVLQKIMTGVNGAAKIQLFNADPSKQNSLSQSMVIMYRERQREGLGSPDPAKAKPYVSPSFLGQ